MSADTKPGKKWLREASMRRLSLFVKNKTEMIGNAAQLGVGVIHTDKLEKSGLSASEIFHLEQWVSGIETGRQCMLAILDSRLVQKLESEQIDKGEVMTNKDDFKPVDLIRSLLHLPEEFLCDGGYIYETVFQRPPTGVVREALQMLVRTAMEKSPSQLGIEQINLAIKQLRLNNLGDLSEAADYEDTEEKNDQVSKTSVNCRRKGTAAEEAFRLQIMIELVRIHIVKMNRNAPPLLADKSCSSSWTFQSPPSTFFNSPSISEAPPERLAMDAIERHLRTPLKVAFEQAGAMSAEELEGTNTLLKPYLKQLSALKAALAAELKDLQDSRAFLALGLSSEATDEAIKKAYRSLAIRLHPDKPGGDTARFQQLQDSYQEIIRKRKADSAERAAMEEVRSKYRQKTANSSAEDTDSLQKASEDTIDDSVGPICKEGDDKQVTEEGKTAEEREECEDENEDIMAEFKEGSASSALKYSGDNEDECEKLPQNEASDEESEEKDCCGDDEADADEFDVEAVMRGLDGSEDVDEVFRRLAEHSKSRAYSSLSDADAKGVKGPGAGISGQSAPAVHYENETEHAQAVVKQVSDLLQRIKRSAAECTQLAQLNIKWQKMFTKVLEPPCVLKDVLKLFTATSGAKCVRKVVDPAALPISNMDACALQQAIMPVELICDWAQQVSALAMELPNECGIRYAAAASGNRAFLSAVERSMQLSLGALKTVLGLINTQEQLASCVRRVKDSQKLAAENPEIQDLLLEMVRTGVKSNVVTITGAVDRIVETAMAASEVRDQVMQLMKEVERQERAEVKLRAAEAESRQTEEDYCEEDREALRKCREDRRNEDRNMRRGQEAEKDKESDLENKQGDGSLDDLKDKIRQLQVQLKVQHIQALQSMNSEVVGLQTQIITELKGLPFVTSFESLFTENASSLLKPRSVTTELSEPDCCSEALQPESRDFKTSLLTLVAELVDSACHAIRNDLIRDSTEPAANSSRELVDKHLGWMRIMLADGSSYSRAQLDAVVAALAEQSTLSPVCNNGENDEPACAISTEGYAAMADNRARASETVPDQEVTMRLALLPDYRSKTLYLASLVDLNSVQDIIGPQLLQRLEEILLEGRECINRHSVPSESRAENVFSPMEVEDSEKGTQSVDKCGVENSSLTEDAVFHATSVDINLNDIDDEYDIDFEINLTEEVMTELTHSPCDAHPPIPPSADQAMPPVPPDPSSCRTSLSQQSSVSPARSSSDCREYLKHVVTSTSSPVSSAEVEGENRKPNIPLSMHA